jgi:hypothetical protein
MELDGSEVMNLSFLNYIRNVDNNKDLCTVCCIQEVSRQPWLKYQLACRHLSHSRCLRKHLSEKDCLHCVACDKELEMTLKNRYCANCDDFGHHFTKCPKLNDVPLGPVEIYEHCDRCNDSGFVLQNSSKYFCWCKRASDLLADRYVNK